MAPIKPHWAQPSHPDVQEVIVNDAEFTTKSISKVTLPPFGLFAKLEFPPCTNAPEPTYATVQMGRDKHLDLNSDLLYINHSCEPTLFFDMAAMNVIVGPKGLKPGDELTFFYPSTEWSMAQSFDCLCGTPTCRGRIAGARDMTLAQLDGLWLNGHIRDLLEERENGSKKLQNGTATNGNGLAKASENGAAANGNSNGQNGNSAIQTATDKTAEALAETLAQAEKVVDAARVAIESYMHLTGAKGKFNGETNGKANGNGVPPGYDAVQPTATKEPAGSQRRGPTSRELSGEMGGDTSVHN